MITVAAFYQFTRFPDPEGLRPAVLAAAVEHGIRGTILLAGEGINGTIAGPKSAVDAVLSKLRALPGCKALRVQESQSETQPFGRMKVRLKREIVTMGQPWVDPMTGAGQRVAAKDWNALIRAHDVAVIDTRNAYEVAIGSFQGAVDPATDSFGDFPGWWQQNAHRFAGKRIAMFCTGGIRCEKSTAYLMSHGVADVFHLDGGILNYLETVAPDDNLFDGECFVFDGRVSVGPGLIQGPHQNCHACRRPLTEADRASPRFEEGVACPHCAEDYSNSDRARFRERHRQMQLCAERGQRHLGA